MWKYFTVKLLRVLVLAPEAVIPPAKVAAPVRAEVPVTLRLPPMKVFFAIPAPPAMMSAPVVLEVACVVLAEV